MFSRVSSVGRSLLPSVIAMGRSALASSDLTRVDFRSTTPRTAVFLTQQQFASTHSHHLDDRSEFEKNQRAIVKEINSKKDKWIGKKIPDEDIELINSLSPKYALEVMKHCCVGLADYSQLFSTLFEVCFNKDATEIPPLERISMFRDCCGIFQQKTASYMVEHEIISPEEKVANNYGFVRYSMLNRACMAKKIDGLPLVKLFFEKHEIDLENRVLGPSVNPEITKYCLQQYEQAVQKTGDCTTYVQYCIASLNKYVGRGDDKAALLLINDKIFGDYVLSTNSFSLGTYECSKMARHYIAEELGKRRVDVNSGARKSGATPLVSDEKSR